MDVAIAGHEHSYERFALMDAQGRPDPRSGIRLFVAGTGGAHLYTFVDVKGNSEVRISEFGVIKLSLRPDGYTWEFVGEVGVLDSGLKRVVELVAA